VPIIGIGEQTNIIEAVAQHTTIDPADMRGFDLVLTDTQPPATFGIDDAFFAAPRLDNLVSVHAGLRAILDAESEHMTVLAAFDHEEDGSETRNSTWGPMLDSMMMMLTSSHNVSTPPHCLCTAPST